MEIGAKLLREDGTSLNGQFRYKPGPWMEVPGNGAYVAISGGLTSGGHGERLVILECREELPIDAPNGVKCYRHVRIVTDQTIPESLCCGSLDLGSLTKLEPGCLPQSVGGSLYLGSLTKLEPGCLPQRVGGYHYLRSLTKLEPGTNPRNFRIVQ